VLMLIDVDLDTLVGQSCISCTDVLIEYLGVEEICVAYIIGQQIGKLE
jgi:hypothetical protein